MTEKNQEAPAQKRIDSILVVLSQKFDEYNLPSEAA